MLKKYKKLIFYFTLLGLFIFSLPALKGSGRDIDYFSNLIRIISKFFPPDFSDIQAIGTGLKETLQISFIATVFASIMALFLGVLSSIVMPASIQNIFKFLISFIRAIPSLIWAILAVAVVGPNSLAGVIALTIYSIGYLSKFVTDDVASFNLSLKEALEKWGAGRMRAFRYGVWPQLKKRYFSHVIWMFEYNIRSASIIGIVGAGGLGFQLHIYQEYGQWDKFSAVLFVILIIVLTMEYATSRKP